MILLKDLPPLIYYYQKNKDSNLADAIMYGFNIQHWRPCGDARAYPGEWIHVINSLQYGAFQILKECVDKKKMYIFIDNGYVFNHFTSDFLLRPYRIVPNAFQHYWSPYTYDNSRLKDIWGGDIFQILKKWTYGRGDHILLIPQSSWESNKLFDLHAFARTTYDALQTMKYKGKITIRQKGFYQQNLYLDLKDAQACLAYTSNVAVDAILEGIPTFCSKWSAAAPIANPIDDFTISDFNVDSSLPTRKWAQEPNRISWLNALMCGQFTHTEISNGFAKEAVMLEMLRRLNENAKRTTGVT